MADWRCHLGIHRHEVVARKSCVYSANEDIILWDYRWCSLCGKRSRVCAGQIKVAVVGWKERGELPEHAEVRPDFVGITFTEEAPDA